MSVFRRAPRAGLLAAAVAAAALGGCAGGKPSATFDLNAPGGLPRAGGAGRGNLVVAEPAAVAVIDGQRVVVKPDAGQVNYLPNAQWADRLPKLVQAKIIEAYENSNRLQAVGRPGDRLSVDYQLVSEIRSFEIDAATGQAVVELTAKVVNDKSGKIVAARVFTSRRPLAGAIDGPTATRALDGALGDVLTELVTWTARSV